MIALLCGLIAAGLTLLLGCYLELPVSTTHTIVGALIGCGMVISPLQGTGAVTWYKKVDPGIDTNVIGYDGFVGILVFWFLAPVIALIFAAVIFVIIKYAVLIYDNSYKRAQYAFPIVIGFTIFIGVFLVLGKANSGGLGNGISVLQKKRGEWIVVVMALAIGVGIGLLSIGLNPLLKKLVERRV